MKKDIFVSILLVVLIVMVANTDQLAASETRTFSMGQIGKYIRDDTNIMPFPGTLMDYDNQIRVELRNYYNQPDRYFGGVHFPLSIFDHIIGIYLNRPLDFTTPSVGINQVTLNRTTDILYAMPLGENNLGFRISYASDSYQQDSTAALPYGIEESAWYFELAAGLSNELYDVGLSLHFPSIKSNIDGYKDEWGGFGLMLNARAFIPIANEKSSFVPLVDLEYSSTSQDIDTLTYDYGTFNLVVGSALNYQINEQTLMVFGVELYGIQHYSAEYEGYGDSTRSTLILPAFFIGAESTLNTWLTGRCGIRQSFESTTEKFDPEGGSEAEVSRSDSDISFMFGFGIKLGSFIMDADLNQSLFFDGPQFISGRSNQLFNRISITYKF